MNVISVGVRLLTKQKDPMLLKMIDPYDLMAMNGPMMTDPPQGPGMGDDDDEAGLVTKTRVRTKKPSLYRVVILNDDYTPMEFVVFILERLFNKTSEEAYKIMLHVHNHGVGICGIFTYEVAETKVAQVRDLARRNEHPLRCDLERED